MSDATYAIGDIHGHLHKLQQLHALIEKDRKKHNTHTAKIVHIGDLTDRGPDSCGVINYLINGINNHQPWVVVKGNHDRLFQMFVDNPTWIDRRLRPDFTWLHERMGGVETLASYGIEGGADRAVSDLQAAARKAVPSVHLDFLRTLPLRHQTADLLFVHAGIRPDVAIDKQVEDDMLWIRQEFIESKVDFGPLVIHGHTMVNNIEHRKNRLNIDTGAGRGDALSAVVIDHGRVWQISDGGRFEVPVLDA